MKKRKTVLFALFSCILLLLAQPVWAITPVQVAKLLPSSREDEGLGASVSISGDTAVIGGPRANNDNGISSGAAYIFTRSGTAWTQQAKLTASAEGEGLCDPFGDSVSVAGDTVVMGTAFSTAAYVFTRSGTTWTEQARLAPSDFSFNDFGHSVSFSDDTTVIGAIFDDDNGQASGSAYVFTRSGTTWTQQAKLTASDGQEFDEFGSSVSVSGDTVGRIKGVGL